MAWLFKVIWGWIWRVEDEDLLGTWFFSDKFVLHGFVWFDHGRCSGRVFANDYICGGEIFLVYCRILNLITASLSSPFRFNTFVFSFILWFVITTAVSPPSELACYMSDLSLCGVLVLLDMNLHRFSSGLSVTLVVSPLI